MLGCRLNGGCVLFSALLVLVHLAKVSMTRVESLLPSACALLFDLFGLFHLSWCLSHAIVLASKDEAHGRALCSFGLLCAWNGDSAALLCGKVLGRIKPFPKISKGKTVAGMGGALLGSMITAIGLGMASRTFFDAGKNTPSVCLALLLQMRTEPSELTTKCCFTYRRAASRVVSFLRGWPLSLRCQSVQNGRLFGILLRKGW